MIKKTSNINTQKAQECAFFALSNKECEPKELFEKLQTFFPSHKTERVLSNFLKTFTLELARQCYKNQNWSLFENVYAQFSHKIFKDKIRGRYSEFNHPNIFENKMLMMICDESVELMDKNPNTFSLSLFSEVLKTLQNGIGITSFEGSFSKKLKNGGYSYRERPQIILKINSIEALTEKKYELLFFWINALSALKDKESDKLRYKDNIKSIDVKSMYMSAYERVSDFDDFKRFDLYFPVSAIDFSSSLLPERFAFLCNTLLKKSSSEDLVNYFVEKCEESSDYFNVFSSLIFSDYTLNIGSEPKIPFISHLNEDDINKLTFLKESYRFVYNHNKKLYPSFNIEDIKIKNFNDVGYYAKDKSPIVPAPTESLLFFKKVVTEGLIKNNLHVQSNVIPKTRF